MFSLASKVLVSLVDFVFHSIALLLRSAEKLILLKRDFYHLTTLKKHAIGHKSNGKINYGIKIFTLSILQSQTLELYSDLYRRVNSRMQGRFRYCLNILLWTNFLHCVPNIFQKWSKLRISPSLLLHFQHFFPQGLFFSYKKYKNSVKFVQIHVLESKKLPIAPLLVIISSFNFKISRKNTPFLIFSPLPLLFNVVYALKHIYNFFMCRVVV
jgi:hypothetical protein